MSKLFATRKGALGEGAYPNTGNVPTAMSLPGVDPERLKARLYSYAPQQQSAIMTSMSFKFNRPTNAQFRNNSKPSAPKLEPLVSRNRSICAGLSYIYLIFKPVFFAVYCS
jgi:hypothetical protein